MSSDPRVIVTRVANLTVERQQDDPDVTRAVERLALQSVPGNAGSLDLHEGIHDPGPETRCSRWPKALRLHGSNGALVPGRCRSTRLCDYCSRLEAVEISEVLALDAMMGNAPQVYAVLTTRSTSLNVKHFMRSRAQVIKALRRRFPGLEYCCIVEFTTGRAGTSGGYRRVHFNLLLKGIPAELVHEACAIVERVWCEREDADPWAQYVGVVAHEGAADRGALPVRRRGAHRRGQAAGLRQK